jgi:DNA-binding LacI/PurR family transcriptional regulator
MFVSTGVIRTEMLEPFLDVVPVVVIGRPENHPRVYSVSYDEDGNATLLADAVAAQGHRDVAVVIPSTKISVTESRRGQVMARRLKKHGVTVHRIPSPTFGVVEEGITEVMALYDAGTITAAMFPTDLRLLAFLSHARAAGIRTPEDLSVTGCDGILPGIELMGITTVRIPVEQAAARAAAVMQSMLAAPGEIKIEHERLPGTLLPGHTLGPPRRIANS